MPTAADAQKVQRAGGDQGRTDNQDPNKRQSTFNPLIDPINISDFSLCKWLCVLQLVSVSGYVVEYLPF